MTDVKIEAVAWMSDDGRPFKAESEARRNSWNGAFPLYDQRAITALQQRIAELTNANLRMLGERDRARIAEGEVGKLRALIDGAATGEVVEVGDDESGQPRVLVHSTRDELRKGAALAFRKVCIVPIGKALAGEP